MNEQKFITEILGGEISVPAKVMAEYIWHECFLSLSIGGIDVANEKASDIAEKAKEKSENKEYWNKVYEIIPEVF